MALAIAWARRLPLAGAASLQAIAFGRPGRVFAATEARKRELFVQEFLDGQIYSMGLGALDYSSLFSPNVVKVMIARSLTSIAVSADKMDVDSDGDGLPDVVETPFLLKTDKFSADTDGDCFPDGFEVMHAREGFDPLVKDSRGCDPNSPATLGCSCRDTDGDGL